MLEIVYFSWILRALKAYIKVVSVVREGSDIE